MTAKQYQRRAPWAVHLPYNPILTSLYWWSSWNMRIIARRFILKWNDNYNEIFNLLRHQRASKGRDPLYGDLFNVHLCIDTLSSGILLCHVVKQPTCRLSKPRLSKPRKKPLHILSSIPTIMMRSSRWFVALTYTVRCGTAPWPPTESRLLRLLPPSRAESQPYNLHCNNNSALLKSRTERYNGSFPFPSPFNPAPLLL